jgi:membrane protein
MASSEGRSEVVHERRVGSGLRRKRRSARGAVRWMRRSLWRLPAWVTVPHQAACCLLAHEGLELSGYMAFTAILSLFPFLIFAVALAGFIGTAEGAEKVVTSIFNYLPAEVASVLAPAVRSVVAERRGDLLTLGIAFTLWSASSGIEAIRVLLNRSYEVRETRSVWRLRLQSLIFVIVGALVLVTISLAIVLGPLIDRLVAFLGGQAAIGQGIWVLVRYGTAIGITTVSLLALHAFLPNRHMKLREIWPGTLLTLALLLAGAFGFSLYVENLPRYDLTYGSLGGVILTLLFFYISAIFFAYGAEINAALIRRRAHGR